LQPSTLVTPPRRSHSTPLLLDIAPAPSTFSERQNTVIANIMTGIDYERYRMQQAMSGAVPMAKGTWYSHADDVYRAIIDIAEREEAKCLQRLRAEARPLVFCGDASWSHRRLTYDARQSWWVLINADDGEIVLTVILMKSREEKGKVVFQGNYSGSSRGMEGVSFDVGVQKLKAAGLVQLWHGFVCDQDSSVHEQLRADPDTAHVAIHWDPGHIKRNFQQKLTAIYGKTPRKRYQGLAARGGLWLAYSHFTSSPVLSHLFSLCCFSAL
jgi:hypothetical protein